MRYYLTKFFLNYPGRILTSIGIILTVILGYLFPPVGVVMGVFVAVALCVLLIHWANYVDGFSNYIFEELADKFEDNIRENWLLFEEKYKNNPKILKEIYSYKIKCLDVDDIMKIPECLVNWTNNKAYNADMTVCFRWRNHIVRNPMELKKQSNKKILEKMEEIVINADTIYENYDCISNEVLHQNANVLSRDLEILRKEMRQAIGIETEFQSVYQEVAEKHSFGYLIPVVKSILEKNPEFEETMKKLNQIQSLLPKKQFPAKLRIVLEDLIIHASNFEQSNNESYKNEVRELIQKVNKYFDEILENETEMTVMEEIASVRALKEFVS